MATWRIYGAERQTGSLTTISVEAADEDKATEIASDRGVIIHSLERLAGDSEEWMPDDYSLLTAAAYMLTACGFAIVIVCSIALLATLTREPSYNEPDWLKGVQIAGSLTGMTWGIFMIVGGQSAVALRNVARKLCGDNLCPPTE